MSRPAKYIIFKLNIDDGPEGAEVSIGEVVTDGTVLRRQDKLTAPVLQTYAALAQGSIEILEEALTVVPHESNAYKTVMDQIEGLQRSKEYALDEAARAHEEGRKFPD